MFQLRVSALLFNQFIAYYDKHGLRWVRGWVLYAEFTAEFAADCGGQTEFAADCGGGDRVRGRVAVLLDNRPRPALAAGVGGEDGRLQQQFSPLHSSVKLGIGQDFS